MHVMIPDDSGLIGLVNIDGFRPEIPEFGDGTEVWDELRRLVRAEEAVVWGTGEQIGNWNVQVSPDLCQASQCFVRRLRVGAAGACLVNLDEVLRVGTGGTLPHPTVSQWRYSIAPGIYWCRVCRMDAAPDDSSKPHFCVTLSKEESETTEEVWPWFICPF